LGTYIYYSVTLLDFFKTSLSMTDLERAEKDGSLDRLARARQALSINPGITRGLVNRFRESQHMEVPNIGQTQPSKPTNGYPLAGILSALIGRLKLDLVPHGGRRNPD
jgi:hypothetical protein